MHINWLGQTCVKLQTKNLKDEDVVILIDAYKPPSGDFPRSFTPQLAIFSIGDRAAKATLSQNPLVIDTLGECESRDAMVYSLAGPENSADLIFKIIAEGMTIVHLGRINRKLTSDTIGQIGSPDILFLPVGGAPYLDPEVAAQIVTTLEPRIVIPLGHHCDTDPKAGPVSDFIKNMGLKPEATEKKIIVKKKDLPQEETKLIILEKSY